MLLERNCFLGSQGLSTDAADLAVGEALFGAGRSLAGKGLLCVLLERNSFLGSQGLSTDAADLAIGEALFGAGRSLAGKGLLGMLLGRNYFLRNQDFTADTAVLTLGKTGSFTIGFHRRIHNLDMLTGRNKIIFVTVAAADAGVGSIAHVLASGRSEGTLVFMIQRGNLFLGFDIDVALDALNTIGEAGLCAGGIKTGQDDFRMDALFTAAQKHIRSADQEIIGINGPVFVGYDNGIPLRFRAAVINNRIIGIHQQGAADCLQTGGQIQLLHSFRLPEGGLANGSDAFGEHQGGAAGELSGIGLNDFHAIGNGEGSGEVAGKLNQGLSVLGQEHVIFCGVVGIVGIRDNDAAGAAERIAVGHTGGTMTVANIKGFQVFRNAGKIGERLTENLRAEIRNGVGAFLLATGISNQSPTGGVVPVRIEFVKYAFVGAISGISFCHSNGFQIGGIQDPVELCAGCGNMNALYAGAGDGILRDFFKPLRKHQLCQRGAVFKAGQRQNLYGAGQRDIF